MVSLSLCAEFTRAEGSLRPLPAQVVQRRQGVPTHGVVRLRALHQPQPQVARVPVALHRRQAQERRQGRTCVLLVLTLNFTSIL